MPETERQGSRLKGAGNVTAVWADDGRTPRAGSRRNVQVLPSLATNDGAEEAAAAGRWYAQGDSDELRSQTMVAIGEFACGTAHDFAKLLAGIILDLSQLRGQQQSKKLEATLNGALQAARRGLRATQSLVEVARHRPARSGIHRPARSGILDPNECIRRIEPLLRQATGFAVQLVLVLDAAVWKVKVNVDAAVLALVNLGANARDAMPQGGLLRVETANVALCGEIGGLNGEFVAITVADNGMGMPEHVRAQASEPSFTADGVRNGIGVGLAQVRELARRERGAVSISSAVGRGTAVTLYLPRAMSTHPRSESTVQR